MDYRTVHFFCSGVSFATNSDIQIFHFSNWKQITVTPHTSTQRACNVAVHARKTHHTPKFILRVWVYSDTTFEVHNGRKKSRE
jgi:hypothetical protein